MNPMRLVAAGFLILSVTTLLFVPIAFADDVNPGLLAISVAYPKQVAPGAPTMLKVDAQYAAREPIAIKSVLYEGTLQQLGFELWHSNVLNVTEGGDATWSLNLTAPSSEGTWSLIAFAYFLRNGSWLYYNDSLQGPGVIPFSIKIAKLATLQVDLGVPGISISIGDSNITTSTSGAATAKLPVSSQYAIAVPEEITLQNSTRLIFKRWNDGRNVTRDVVLLDGDKLLVANYARQYLLQLQSPVSAYVGSTWYDAGSNVSLYANSTVPFPWPLSDLGVEYTFQGWSGSVESTSNPLNITMNGPKSVNIDYSANYGPLIILGIMFVGITGAIITILVSRRRFKVPETKPEQAELTAEEPTVEEERADVPNESSLPEKTGVKFCDSCGKAVEKDWTHCANCGRNLRTDASASSESLKGGES